MERTLPQLLLAAATGLPGRFTEADLVVAAWGQWPERFGLPGHREHPDSNKVRTLLVGRRGLVARAYVRRVAPLTYEVTPYGRAAVSTGQQRMTLPKLTPQSAATIAKLIAHPAFTRFRGGLPEMMQRGQAREFLSLAVPTFLAGVIGASRNGEVAGVGGPYPEALIRQLAECRTWIARTFRVLA